MTRAERKAIQARVAVRVLAQLGATACPMGLLPALSFDASH
jgi:hypothetical protein